MINKEKIIYLIIGLLVILGLAGLINYKNNRQTAAINNGEMVFYYGDGCPHCVNVEKFITDNNIEEKIKFAKKEVFNNEANATEMSLHAEDCGLDIKQLGVPFFWTGSICLTGDQPIIDYLKDKAGIK